jgi:glycosyltransferase involved in cell wall biosynthesis
MPGFGTDFLTDIHMQTIYDRPENATYAPIISPVQQVRVASVVVPTYRRPALLRRCLQALLAQQLSHGSFEIIVVSDGPDADTESALLDIIPTASIPIRYISLPRHQGPAAARNAGWRHASSDLIAFTDDDCIPEATWLNTFCESAQRCGALYVAFSGRTIVPIAAVPTDYEKNIAHLCHAEFITANCACTRHALLQAGGFDERFRMAWREDSDLQFNFMERGIPLFPVNEARVVHPVRARPWGISLREEKKGMFNALLYKKYPKLYRERIEQKPQWNYYVMVSLAILAIAGTLAKLPLLAAIGFGGWLVLTAAFVVKRLKGTALTPSHVAEMVVTSMFIPFLSVGYRFYGAWRYKALPI